MFTCMSSLVCHSSVIELGKSSLNQLSVLLIGIFSFIWWFIFIFLLNEFNFYLDLSVECQDRWNTSSGVILVRRVSFITKEVRRWNDDIFWVRCYTCWKIGTLNGLIFVLPESWKANIRFDLKFDGCNRQICSRLWRLSTRIVSRISS